MRYLPSVQGNPRQVTVTGQVFSERERIAIQKVAAKHYSLETAEQVACEVARMFNVSVEEIRGEARTMRLVDARTVIAFALRQRGFRLHEIGRYLNRHTSSIVHLSQRAVNVSELREMAEALS